MWYVLYIIKPSLNTTSEFSLKTRPKNDLENLLWNLLLCWKTTLWVINQFTGLKSCTGLWMILTIWDYKHGNGSGKRPRDVIELYKNSEGRSSTRVPVLLYLNKVWFLPSYTPCLYKYWFLTRGTAEISNVNKFIYVTETENGTEKK